MSAGVPKCRGQFQMSSESFDDRKAISNIFLDLIMAGRTETLNRWRDNGYG